MLGDLSETDYSTCYMYSEILMHTENFIIYTILDKIRYMYMCS